MLARSLFLLSLLTIPLQLNKFFFVPSSFVLGLPIDYRAIAIYLSDFAVIAYLIFFTRQNFHHFGKLYRPHRNFVLALFLINTYLLASALTNLKANPSLWLSLKILEFSLFSLFATIDLAKYPKLTLNVITFSLVWQAIVIALQFAYQGSLGFWFLGERTFDVTTTNIAHVDLFGHQFLRPYGTFPHPNVAAAFLTLYLLMTSYRRAWFIIPLLALTLTFSKAAFFAIATGLGIISRKPFILIALAVASPLILLKTTTDLSIASIAERITLLKASMDIALINPLFGVGTGNFTLYLSKLNLISLAQIRLIQPVHNVFFLILSENGIVGLLLFSFLLLTVASYAVTRQKIAVFASLLIFASFDHFIWTLQQGQLLFWLAIAYIISSNRANWTNKTN